MSERHYDLVRPCTNCPFRTDETAIRFAARERDEEIEESAYRYGFPCHTTAEDEDGYGLQDGFYFGENSQHCVGYIIMSFKAGYDVWPGINNDEELAARLLQQVDWQAPASTAPRTSSRPTQAHAVEIPAPEQAAVTRPLGDAPIPRVLPNTAIPRTPPTRR